MGLKKTEACNPKMVFKICEGISSFSVKELDVIVHKKYFPYITMLHFGHCVPHITSEPGGWGGIVTRPYWRQTITWTDDDPVRWRIYASSALNMLMPPTFSAAIGQNIKTPSDHDENALFRFGTLKTGVTWTPLSTPQQRFINAWQIH